MLVAGAVCPGPPLLVPEVAAGAAVELDTLREACADVVRVLFAARPERIVVVGDAPATGYAEGQLDLSVFGLASASTSRALPLALGIGQWLLSMTMPSVTPPSVSHVEVGLLGVAASESSTACGELGAALAGESRCALLVVADASTARPPFAPRTPSSDAEAFDAAVARALAEVDVGALLALDPSDARRVGATGRAAWQVLAGATAVDGDWWGRVAYNAAPYGVGYLAAAWSRR